MDRWKYYGITHRDHVICNPLSSAKLDRFIDTLRLPPQARVVDFALRQGRIAVCRICERYGASGVGVDLSPWEVPAARHRISERGLADRLEIVEGDGADYQGGGFDLALCVGATWIWRDLAGTLDALAEHAGPGGLVGVGEVFARRTPPDGYVAEEPDFTASLVSHADNVAIARGRGLRFLGAVVASQDDWDHYEHQQTLAAEHWAAANPDDPDVVELLAMREREDELHLRFARDTLGWALYLFSVGTLRESLCSRKDETA